MGAFAHLLAVLVVGVPAVTGLVLVAGGVLRWLSTQRLARIGQAVTAIVAENQSIAHGDGNVRFRPVVRFRTVDGRDVRTVLAGPSSVFSHVTEMPIDVLYDPADPRRAAAAGLRTGGGLGAIVVGTIFLLFGLFAVTLTRTMLQ